jgi:hypothetical protein
LDLAFHPGHPRSASEPKDELVAKVKVLGEVAFQASLARSLRVESLLFGNLGQLVYEELYPV